MATFMNLREERVTSFLDSYTASLGLEPAKLAESIRYSLLTKGKRIRPILLLTTLAAQGKDEKIGIPFAAALEMIHTYSLIHDDLPCMDDDDTRRGQPSNHIVFGEAIAVLTGDALLTEAFSLLTSGARDAKLQLETLLSLQEQIVLSIGAKGMIAGQALDVGSECKQVSLTELEQIHRRKTGDLIVLAVYIGSVLGEAAPSDHAYLMQFAHHLGFAFQIRDDILDITEGQNDNAKACFPSLLGLEESKMLLYKETQAAKDALLSCRNVKIDELLELADLLLCRNN